MKGLIIKCYINDIVILLILKLFLSERFNANLLSLSSNSYAVPLNQKLNVSKKVKNLNFKTFVHRSAEK